MMLGAVPRWVQNAAVIFAAGGWLTLGGLWVVLPGTMTVCLLAAAASTSVATISCLRRSLWLVAGYGGLALFGIGLVAAEFAYGWAFVGTGGLRVALAVLAGFLVFVGVGVAVTSAGGIKRNAFRTGLTVGAGAGGATALLLAVRRQWLNERAQVHTETEAVERRVTELGRHACALPRCDAWTAGSPAS